MPMPMPDIVFLDVVTTTQEEVRARLDTAEHGVVVAVAARSQLAGRGRGGRVWQDPPGAAMMLSIGHRRALAADLLDGLPRRIPDALLDCLGDAGCAADALRWKAPNDIVAARDGAKVAGMLVDARTRGSLLEEVIVGVGINLHGPPFSTDDGRAATSVHAETGVRIDPDDLARVVARRMAAVLTRASDGPDAGSADPVRSVD